MKNLLFIVFVAATFSIGCGEIVKNEDGSTNYNYFYLNGGLKKQKTITVNQDGSKTYYWRFYYENGQLKKEGLSTEDNLSNGVWKFYYESGKLKSETEFVDEVRHGKAVYYREDGSIEVQGIYNNGEFLED